MSQTNPSVAVVEGPRLVVGRRAVALTPHEGLALAEQLAREAFRGIAREIADEEPRPARNRAGAAR